MSSRYLITGGTGSFGKTMVNELLKDKSTEAITVLSRDEEKQDHLRNKLRDDRIKWHIGDVRDFDSVLHAMKGVTNVFHAAALKQVPSCEFFPMQAVKTNIIGSENVIRAAIANKARSLVCLSTDKAVFPVNAMGISKAMMERMANAASRELGINGETTISCVRYGNVMCSRGSVIPLFMEQISANSPITITEPTMTRFLMPLSESVELVNFAFKNAMQGDLFIKKASSATIIDLVSAIKSIMKKPNHPVECIGWRHGEKLFETLASAQELSTAEDLGDYWRLQSDLRSLDYRPFFSEGDKTVGSREDFDSHNCNRLTVEEIEVLLLSIPEVTDFLTNKGIGVLEEN